MLRGGNGRYRRFLEELGLGLSFSVKYLSNAAHYYSCQLTGQHCPVYQLEDLTQPYSPQSQGWLSFIYTSAGSVLGYTTDLSSRLVDTVSSPLASAESVLSFTTGLGSQVVDAVSRSFVPTDSYLPSQGVLGSAAKAVGSVAEAAGSVVSYAFSPLMYFQQKESKEKPEFICLKAFAGEAGVEAESLAICQSIIESADTSQPIDFFETLGEDESPRGL
jgi:hypothetical protein